jgi:hypothetical protein
VTHLHDTRSEREEEQSKERTYRISSRKGGAAQEEWIETRIGGEGAASARRACMATMARARTDVRSGARRCIVTMLYAQWLLILTRATKGGD